MALRSEDDSFVNIVVHRSPCSSWDSATNKLSTGAFLSLEDPIQAWSRNSHEERPIKVRSALQMSRGCVPVSRICKSPYPYRQLSRHFKLWDIGNCYSVSPLEGTSAKMPRTRNRVDSWQERSWWLLIAMISCCLLRLSMKHKGVCFAFNLSTISTLDNVLRRQKRAIRWLLWWGGTFSNLTSASISTFRFCKKSTLNSSFHIRKNRITE